MTLKLQPGHRGTTSLPIVDERDLRTTTSPVIGEKCFGMQEWSDAHDGISVDC
jgi:hypothetical protein